MHNYDNSKLEQILTGSALTQWQLIAQQVRAEKSYRKYEHEVKVESVNTLGTDSQRAVVEATVKESTKFYEHGQIKNTTDEKLRVRYDLIRKEGVWRIQSMSVANK